MLSRNGEGSYCTISYVTCQGSSWREIRAVTQLRSEVEQLRRSLDHPREQSNSFDKCSWTTIRNKVINEKTVYQKR